MRFLLYIIPDILHSAAMSADEVDMLIMEYGGRHAGQEAQGHGQVLAHHELQLQDPTLCRRRANG